MSENKTFGELFNEAKIEREITFRFISERVGKTIGYLSDIAQGRKSPPDIETVKQIEEILSITDGRLTIAAVKERLSPKARIVALTEENERLKQILEFASITVSTDGTPSFKPKALKYYCQQNTREENERLKREIEPLRKLARAVESYDRVGCSWGVVKRALSKIETIPNA